MSNSRLKLLRDEQLMTELAGGNHGAFKEILRRYETPCIEFCESFVRNRNSAENLAQETFLHVFRDAKRYQPVARFTTWFYKIAAGRCIIELKKRQARNA